MLPNQGRRPFIASEVTNLSEAEKWRHQVVKELSRNVSLIQDGKFEHACVAAALFGFSIPCANCTGGAGEHRIRDLNDQINKLIREKKHWERQIKALGGADYIVSLLLQSLCFAVSHRRTISPVQTSGRVVTDSDGSYALGDQGYYYFGAAKELPGVRELFEARRCTCCPYLACAS